MHLLTLTLCLLPALDSAALDLEGLPPLECATGLPSAETCAARLDFSDAYLASMGATEFTGWDGAVACVADALIARRPWKLALAVADRSGTPRQRREALRDLAALVGWRAVLTGELPPPVPFDQIPALNRRPPCSAP